VKQHNFSFLGKYILSGEITCLTGLHIGGSTTGVEIGGLDNPVIKDPLTEYPYIPGSGLKGKLRSLLEWKLGRITYHEKHKGFTACSCGECAACVIFGASSDDTEVRLKAGPSRLTVRDAFPSETTKEKWLTWLGEGIYTEVKTENTLDRVTAEANPRPMERVPAGSAFQFEMIFDVYQPGDYLQLRELFSAMHLLEHSALGGSGSRGHGQIRFEKVVIAWRPVAFYTSGKAEQAKTIKTMADKESMETLLKSFDQLAWPQNAAR
jgi:CRISPR-associated protein Csm3